MLRLARGARGARGLASILGVASILEVVSCHGWHQYLTSGCEVVEDSIVLTKRK